MLIRKAYRFRIKANPHLEQQFALFAGHCRFDCNRGEFFKTQKELTTSLINFQKTRYNRQLIKKHAQLFSERKFLNNLEKYLIEVYEKEQEKKSK